MASTYAQTQFLGCSVVNFSMNLGWGGESSTCTIKLAADYSAHWNSQSMAPIHNYRNVLRQRPGVTNKPSVTQSQAFNDQDLDKDDKISQSLLRNVSEHESARRDTLLSDVRNETDPKRKDIGKKCWDTLNGTSSAAPIDWFDPDPGFIGNKNHFAVMQILI